MIKESTIDKIEEVMYKLKEWQADWYENVLDPEQVNEPSPYTDMIKDLRKSLKELSKMCDSKSVREHYK